MIRDDSTSISEPAPKPNGIVLALIAGCIAVGAPFVTTYLGLRDFDVDPRVPRYQAIMSLPVFFVAILPIILLILFAIRRKFMHPLLRTLLVLSPALLLTMPGLIEALVSPTKPDVSFAERIGHPIPDDAGAFKAWFSHSPGESSYMFTFRCSAESTESLLAANTYKLVENPAMLDPEMGQYFQLPIGGVVPPKGWPQPKTWAGIKIYSSDVPGGYRYLLTDADKSRVFILVGNT